MSRSPTADMEQHTWIVAQSIGSLLSLLTVGPFLRSG
jgi:hypothetical protein